MPAPFKAMLGGRLPDWVEPRWFTNREDALAMGPGTQIGWFDMFSKEAMAEAIANAADLKWLNSLFAGVDGMPLAVLRQRGVIVTNGVGINAITIAEYVVMGMLTVAKGYREVVRAQDRHEWLHDSPGKVELYGSKALLIGYGAIGKLIAERLAPFGVDVTFVRRKPDEKALAPDQWRARLGEFDWVILAVPATPETDKMIGTDELAAMKPTAVLINIARGTVVDQDALIETLRNRKIAAAFLDVTTPEPLPPESPLWTLDNAHITMHLSGRAQDLAFVRSSDRFIENLHRYGRGEALEPQVNLALGY